MLSVIFHVMMKMMMVMRIQGLGGESRRGGGVFLFYALVFSSISIGGGEIRWSNWAFARKVETE